MPQKILLIEDNADNSLLFSYLLESEGFDLTLATTAEEALQLIETFTPDFIISDIALPGMSGTHFIQKIRQEARFKDIFALAVSAYASLEDKHHILKSGFNEFMEKPIQADRFASTVKQMYNHYQAKK